MNANLIGVIFITCGVIYGSLAFDKINNATLGYLISNDWLKLPTGGKNQELFFGKKPTIILYSLIFIFLGIMIIIKLN